MLTRYRFAISSQDIELCYCRDVIICLRRKRFQTEITSFHWSSKSYFLPTVARSESTFMYYFLTCQFQFFSILAVRFGSFFTKHIKNRFLQAFDRSLGRTFQIQYENFILSFFEPATRHKEGLLRTDFPETPHCMTVHPNHTFTPCAHIQKCISYFIQFKSALVVSRHRR